MDKKAMYQFSCGVYLVSTTDEDKDYACLINTGMQVTGNPLQISVTLNKENATAQAILRSGHFALTTLTEEADIAFAGPFGFRTSTDFDKFEGHACQKTVLGDTYTPECAGAVIAAKVVNTLDVGSHIIFVGAVEDSQVISDTTPMTYAYYHSTLKGKTPPKASSFIG